MGSILGVPIKWELEPIPGVRRIPTKQEILAEKRYQQRQKEKALIESKKNRIAGYIMKKPCYIKVPMTYTRFYSLWLKAEELGFDSSKYWNECNVTYVNIGEFNDVDEQVKLVVEYMTDEQKEKGIYIGVITITEIWKAEICDIYVKGNKIEYKTNKSKIVSTRSTKEIIVEELTNAFNIKKEQFLKHFNKVNGNSYWNP